MKKIISILLLSASSALAGINFISVQPQPANPPYGEMDHVRWTENGEQNSVFLVSVEDRQKFADAVQSFNLPRDYTRVVIYFDGNNVDRIEWSMSDPVERVLKHSKDLSASQKSKLEILRALIEAK